MPTKIDNNNKIINYIESKIKPHTLSEIGKSNIAVLLDEFSFDDLCSAVDTSFKTYIRLDKNGEPTQSSVAKFLEKIGGIAHNNSLSPIEQKIRHLKNIGAKRFNYWDDKKATAILNRYVRALRNSGWNDDSILFDLNNEAMDRANECSNWTQWKNLFEGWTDYLEAPKDTQEDDLTNTIRINKEYEIIEEIGHGSFGTTYLCNDKNIDKNFVIKKFTCGMLKESDNKKFFQKFIVEILALFDLHHQNIVSIYDYMVDEEKNIGLYVMEYIDGNNIEEYLTINKSEINEIFTQVIDAFCYLESRKLCHRDIRINNILVNKLGEVKLIDFGFVKNISESNSIHSATKMISYPYDWPEELKAKTQTYDNKTEIYFIGKLFDDLIKRLNINTFKYNYILKIMKKYSYGKRVNSFHEIKKLILIINHEEYIATKDYLDDLN